MLELLAYNYRSRNRYITRLTRVALYVYATAIAYFIRKPIFHILNRGFKRFPSEIIRVCLKCSIFQIFTKSFQMTQISDIDKLHLQGHQYLALQVISTVLLMDLKMSTFKHVKKHQLFAQVDDKQLQKCKILLSRIHYGRLPNLVFGDEKKFDVGHHLNS